MSNINSQDSSSFSFTPEAKNIGAGVVNAPFSLKTPALEFLAVQAKKYPKIQRLILFGSRGRGDDQERSDYDIAVDAPEMSDVEWSQCASFFRENIPTLCG